MPLKPKIQCLKKNHEETILNLQTSFDTRNEAFKKTSQTVIAELQEQNTSLQVRLKATTSSPSLDDVTNSKLEVALKELAKLKEDKKSLLVDVEENAEKVSKMQTTSEENTKLKKS